MVNVLILLFEITLDIVGLISGIIVLTRAQDSCLQKSWGWLITSLSILLLCDNIEWIYIFFHEQTFSSSIYYATLPMEHLSIWHIFRTIIFFQLFSLFPIASLRPGLLSTERIINLSIPMFLILCVILCYEVFNGSNTVLMSFESIWCNIHQLDVKVRLSVFIASVIAPSCNFLFPLFKKWTPFSRKLSKDMYFYYISFGLIMSGYIWLMLGTNGLSFHIFGLVVIIPSIYMNILYLSSENPLSLPPAPIINLKNKEIEAIKEIEVSPVIMELSKKMEFIMKEYIPFTEPEYAIKDLVNDLNTNEHRLNKALRYKGFSGFRDYINFYRLQYFKEEAAKDCNLTIKELMYKSGFSSRSSFYRYFANIENMSPTEYLEHIKKNRIYNT